MHFHFNDDTIIGFDEIIEILKFKPLQSQIICCKSIYELLVFSFINFF